MSHDFDMTRRVIGLAIDAQPVVFLAFDLTRYITSVALPVDGLRTATLFGNTAAGR